MRRQYPPQGADLTFVDDRAVANQPHRTPAFHLPIEDHAAGDVAQPRDLEELTDFDPAHADFFIPLVEHADDGLLKVVDQFVNDAVGANVDFFHFRGGAGVAIRAHMETDDDGVRCFSQRHITFADRTDPSVDDVHPHFVR